MLSTAGEINDGDYSNIFPSITDDCIIQKLVTNEDLLKFISQIMYCSGENYYLCVMDRRTQT
jgi:hypothetical protein